VESNRRRRKEERLHHFSKEGRGFPRKMKKKNIEGGAGRTTKKMTNRKRRPAAPMGKNLSKNVKSRLAWERGDTEHMQTQGDSDRNTIFTEKIRTASTHWQGHIEA